MARLTVLLVEYFCVISVLIKMQRCDEGDSYLKLREDLLQEEIDQFTGSQWNLTENERKVNDYLIKIKMAELEDDETFLPAENFLIAKDAIQRSKVFQFIQKVPKGASLHTHMLASVNVDFIIKNFTYHADAYGCYNSYNVFKLKILENPKSDTNCTWKSLSSYRKEFEENNKDFDAFLKTQTTLTPEDVTLNKQTTWTKFKNTFSCVYDLVSFKPFFYDYIYQSLQELYDDNLIYSELRGTFMPLYDLDGTVYDPKTFFDTIKQAVADFRSANPEFLGVKYIHSVYRGVDNDTLKTALDQLMNYQSLFKKDNIIAGLDFVGFEEDGHDLVQFHTELLGAAGDIKFFFHAGETNQFGQTDLNLLDAVLLNSSRIGHGFALNKHPKALKMARERNIAVELCPIANQVLKLNEDPRNHPVATLFASGYPVVVGNDDPSAWNATGLSYDWYVTFMSMTWKDQGLKFLKQLASNSIQYSAMNATEKSEAFTTWERQWKRFIDDFVLVI